MAKTYTLQQWTHGDIYTMTATFRSLSNSDPKHLQIAAVAFVYRDSNIYPTAVTVTLINNSGNITHSDVNIYK